MKTIQQTTLVEGVAVGVSAAEPRDQYTLHLKFDDGFERDLDFSPFLRGSSNPHIRVYLEPEKFRQFVVRDGELIWGDYELCFPIHDLLEGKI